MRCLNYSSWKAVLMNTALFTITTVMGGCIECMGQQLRMRLAKSFGFIMDSGTDLMALRLNTQTADVSGIKMAYCIAWMAQQLSGQMGIVLGISTTGISPKPNGNKQ